MPKEHQTSYRVSDDTRENYYGKGYWHSEDFWTSFEKVADQSPHAVALVDRASEISFRDLKSRAIDFGRAARHHGLQPGEVIIIHGRHCIEAVIAILGCAFSGLVPALLPAMFSQEQVLGIVDHTQSRLVVGTGEVKELERVQAAAAQRDIICVMPDDYPASGGCIGWGDFTAADDDSVVGHHPMDPDDLLLLIFSSGTTGAPKGVMHSSNTARFSVNTYADIHDIGRDDTALAVTAFGFVGSSLLGFYLTLLRGCRSVLLRSWEPEETLAHISRYHVSHFLLMPTHAIDILSCPALDDTDCSSVTRGVVAGVGEEYRVDAKNRLCAKPFPMYGMSESPAHVTGRMSDDWQELRTTEGRAMPGTDLLICDDDDQPVAIGESGNILVRGPNRFMGYYRADELNRQAINDDGYFRTGDIGFLNEKGYMTFVSRSKDIIRRGGITITPADVEAVIRPHPRISDVAVVGLPDPRLGERACACLISHDGSEVSLEELTAYLDERGVARYLWPESIQMCEEFPRTPSLKVQKNQLRGEILDRLASQT